MIAAIAIAITPLRHVAAVRHFHYFLSYAIAVLPFRQFAITPLITIDYAAMAIVAADTPLLLIAFTLLTVRRLRIIRFSLLLSFLRWLPPRSLPFRDAAFHYYYVALFRRFSRLFFAFSSSPPRCCSLFFFIIFHMPPLLLMLFRYAARLHIRYDAIFHFIDAIIYAIIDTTPLPSFV